MSFKPYSKYKESGVEWLGRVPEHWEVRRLKSLISRITQGWSPQCESRTADEGEWGVLKVGCVNGANFDPDEQKALPEATEPQLIYEVQEGDILASRGNTLDLVGMSALVTAVRSRLLLSDLLYRFRAIPEVASSGFLVQSLRSRLGRFQIEGSATGTSASMKKVTQEDLRGLLICCPPLEEQEAIKAFLDHETAKIDALIAEQQRLIELLQEKRQAVISHAVTKGLNPNAPMKDSGIEWLGEVPEHWEVMPVWILFELGRGRVISHGEIADNLGPYPVYSSQTENDGVMGSINTYAYEGDFLTWTTDGANAGTVFRRQGLFNCTNVCGTLRARSDRILLEYAHRAIQHATGYFVRHDINPKLMNNVMAAIRIPIPPLAEQTQIAYRVAAVAGRGDSLVTEMNKAISLLQERRSALISAAVTGQIDVRGFNTGGSEAA